MSAVINDLIPYISLAISCFGLGYNIGFVRGRD